MELRILEPHDLTLVAWARVEGDLFEHGGELSTAFAYWRTYGIREWVDLDSDPWMRVTLLHEPEFLPRLADYIQRQSGFICRIEP